MHPAVRVVLRTFGVPLMLPVRGRPHSLPRFPARLLAALLGTALLLAGPVVAPADAAAGSLALKPGAVSSAKIGSGRVTSIAAAAITVPAATPVEIGLQFRAPSPATGYRATLTVAADGAVTAAFARVTAGNETALGAPVSLGLTVKAGDTVRLEGATAGLSTVRVYLRAWKDGSPKPPNWQATGADAASERLKKSGNVYLWARPDAGTSPVKLAYRSTSVGRYSLAKAVAVGVLPPEPNGDTFSIAVIPDTQSETHDPASTRLLNRTRWLVANRQKLDLRYVLHTGDVTDWGWLDANQLARAKAAMGVVSDAGIPFSLTVGNHDTAAVGWDGIKGSTGYGGSAYMYNPECRVRLGAANCNSSLLVRDTRAFNSAFPVSGLRGLGGVYETGKSDNNWTTFVANDTKWLVLTLELWPRRPVVDWAREVVASHPDHNVIIQTHHFLGSNGKISGSNGGYGATSPAYLNAQVISRYPNVKLVFSGHNGSFKSLRTTSKGNTVVAYLGNGLSSKDNPVRVVTVNTTTGDVMSTIHNPLKNAITGRTVHQVKIVR